MTRAFPISPDASEDEFYSALRKYKSNFYIEDEAEREAEYIKWREEARNIQSPGLTKQRRSQQAFLCAYEKISCDGWQRADAVRHALTKFDVTTSDEKAWFRGHLHDFKSVPQHRHELLDDDVEYGVEHVKEALIRKLPHVVAAIFITSDRRKRCRIIRAVFKLVRDP